MISSNCLGIQPRCVPVGTPGPNETTTVATPRQYELGLKFHAVLPIGLMVKRQILPEELS